MERFEYYAFVSYSHQDEKRAKWLHRKLEMYRLPNSLRKEAGSSLSTHMKRLARN